MSAVEESLIEAVAQSFSGRAEDSDEATPVEPYVFDTAFQDKIAALAISDFVFMKRTQGLILPDYFENAATAILVNIAIEHFNKYKEAPSRTAFTQLVKDAIVTGRIRSDLKDEFKAKYVSLAKTKLTDREFVIDKVAEFARHQAIYRAMLQSADLMAKGKLDQIADLIVKAARVGADDAAVTYDYFEEIVNRTQERKDKVAGIKKPQGVTTGHKKLDELLLHEGWGRSELSLILGGAKSGKSTGLLFFAKNAALAGHNTLYVTLEMSAKIAAMRNDASISETEVKELEKHIMDVQDKVKLAQMKAAKYYMAEFPSGSLTPGSLHRLIDSYESQGTRFDLVVVDYLDIMAPDHRTDSAIENSKNIFVGVRAIAQEKGFAILSATQTNREGFKSVTAKAEHVSDDFNKIRIADLTISINVTDDEKARGEARLYFAASRNQEGGMTVQIKQDLSRMIFIKSIMGVI
ncbi:MAG: DNA helicase [Methylomicrobium sp.]|nr:DNA helicase [Methylomicrobium sp.]